MKSVVDEGGPGRPWSNGIEAKAAGGIGRRFSTESKSCKIEANHL